MAALPAAASRQIHRATGAALDRALSVALRTMDADPDPPSDWLHRLAVGATGAGGGAFGLAGLAVELPVSTTIMLRAIADHARAQGEDLARPEPRLQCLSVFAYGSPRAADDAADAGYFAVRAALARLRRRGRRVPGLEGGLPRRRRPQRPGAGPPPHRGGAPVRRGGDGEGRRPARAAPRRRGGCGRQPGLHEPLPAHRLGALHGPATGAGPRRGGGARRLGPPFRALRARPGSSTGEG